MNTAVLNGRFGSIPASSIAGWAEYRMSDLDHLAAVEDAFCSLYLLHPGILPAAVGADMNARLQALSFCGQAHLHRIRPTDGIAHAGGGIGAAGVGDRSPHHGHPVSI